MAEDVDVAIVGHVEGHFQTMDVMHQKEDVGHIQIEDITQKIEVDTMAKEAEEEWDVEDMPHKTETALPTRQKTPPTDIPQTIVILVFVDHLAEFMLVVIDATYMQEVMFPGQIPEKH